jgi:hypothetical protein
MAIEWGTNGSECVCSLLGGVCLRWIGEGVDVGLETVVLCSNCIEGGSGVSQGPEGEEEFKA